jgi:two-component system sensor kinase FixL
MPDQTEDVADEVAERTAELERAQEQLRQSEELYRHVVELSNLMPWTADRNGSVIAVNARWREWTGTEPGEALDANWENFVHPDDVEGLREAWAKAVWNGERFEYDWRMRTADGSYRWFRSRAAKRADDGGGDAVWYGTVEDVQEPHEAEDAFRRAQAELANVSRLSAMGAMASAIAHDLNQPLTAIAQYVRGSKRLLGRVDGPAKADLTEGLDEADRNIVRAADIVRRVREFVTRGTIEARRENLTTLIEEACRFAMADPSAAGISCRAQTDGDCFVMADRVQVRQVLVNLIRNAVAAMEEASQRRIVIRTSPGRPGFCEVAVSDTGVGIAPEAASRIFDPLYTTRDGGMGVGLSICRTIVEAHGGEIWVDTTAGPGATIRFTLPVAPPANGRVPEAGG